MYGTSFWQVMCVHDLNEFFQIPLEVSISIPVSQLKKYIAPQNEDDVSRRNIKFFDCRKMSNESLIPKRYLSGNIQMNLSMIR